MATWAKQPATHRGVNRPCEWYSSGAFALGGGLMPQFETKSPAITLALTAGEVRIASARAAGPPG